MATLKMNCLGGLTFIWQGQRLQSLKSRKGMALLCYMAVTRKTHTRSTLAGLLWTDMPESHARMNLRKTLSRIKLFNPYLTISRETLAIHPNAPLWSDVAEFETAAAARMDIQRLRYAVSLYQGDFLEGFESDDLPLFHEWVLTQRNHLSKTAIEILQILTTHFADQQEYPTAIKYTHHSLKLEPWHEGTHRTLMRLLVASGQRSAAIKQYETCMHRLYDDLAVEPEAETTLLYEQILSGKLEGGDALVKRSLSNQIPETLCSLPSPPSPLVGRVSERSELKTYLAEPIIHLVSIVGAGGMGKTHLALATAHELVRERDLFDGIAFVPLGQVYTHQQCVITIADQLNLKLAGAQNPEKLLLDHLHSRRLLLILDNFEHLLGEVDFLEHILAASPQVKLLITSRERLKIRQEWVLDLQGLPYPEDEMDIQADQTEAVLLFAQRARALRRNFSLENNLAAVTRISKFVQGMPLALELAASWIRVLTAGEIADQITHNLSVLSTNLHSLPERHRTMQAVFDSSWRWLSAEEQSVILKLSVFTGGFTLQAAEQVAGASIPILSDLVDKSFLSRKPQSQDVTRYEIHELICQYASERLRESGQVDAAHNQHLEYFLALAEQAENHWDTKDEKEWLQHLETERNNLHTALQYALDHKYVDLLLRFNAALFTFWIYNSPADEAVYWLETTLALPWDETNPAVMRSRAKVLNVAGYAAVTSANYNLALARFKEGQAIYERIEDPHGIAWSLRGCGYTAMCRGDYASALSYVERSLEICQESGDEWGLVWSWYDQGYLKMINRDLEQSKKLLEKASTQFHQSGNQFGEYRSLIALGFLSYYQGHPAQAASLFQKAISLQQQNSFYQETANALEGLAYAATALDQRVSAVQFLGAAKNLRDTTGFNRHQHFTADYQRGLDLLQASLSKDNFTRLWDEGYAAGRQPAFVSGLVNKLARI